MKRTAMVRSHDVEPVESSARHYLRISSAWTIAGAVGPGDRLCQGMPEFGAVAGRMAVPLHFEPMQSWFVVFRDNGGDHPCREIR